MGLKEGGFRLAPGPGHGHLLHSRHLGLRLQPLVARGKDKVTLKTDKKSCKTDKKSLAALHLLTMKLNKIDDPQKKVPT